MKNQNMFNPHDPKEWLYDRCCKEGLIKLTKKEFEHFFPGRAEDELLKLQEFCQRKGVTFRIDKESKTFSFELDEPDLD